MKKVRKTPCVSAGHLCFPDQKSSMNSHISLTLFSKGFFISYFNSIDVCHNFQSLRSSPYGISTNGLGDVPHWHFNPHWAVQTRFRKYFNWKWDSTGFIWELTSKGIGKLRWKSPWNLIWRYKSSIMRASRTDKCSFWENGTNPSFWS